MITNEKISVSRDLIRYGKSLFTRSEFDSKTVCLNDTFMFARPMGANAELEFSITDDGNGHLEWVAEPVIILSTLEKFTLNFKGRWSVETASMQGITTLLTFFEHLVKNHTRIECYREDTDTESVLLTTEHLMVQTVDVDYKSLMQFLISGILHPKKQKLKNLFSFLQAIEAYWVASFLLSQFMNKDNESEVHKISNASRVYGVSESYFRKLCNNTFSRGPKKQLRQWRAASSALELIEKTQSIATIAGDNGFSSSSHFSSEIKTFFGITPREFKKIGKIIS